ncbi:MULTISPECIES: hypothetical protein [Fusobacterium]|uniref:hypothetical protein n=1 Tax=Fusobacterium TaxID=848 RepID=UPI0014777B5F|nr:MULTISPECIES: hypothetical protein [Fusobacterium]NME35611.1 hypothetical protein [Fusobacterium sp. FSA-380-WT-3A]
MEILSKLGFKKVGEWKKLQNNLYFDVNDFKKENKVVFAFVVNSFVKFISATEDVLEFALNCYVSPKEFEGEEVRVKELILKTLDNGPVEIYALKNTKFFGFKTRFDKQDILKLIKEFNADWNDENLVDRMKKIVGKDRVAIQKDVEEKEKIQTIIEEKPEMKEVLKPEKTKKEYESYIFILGKSYLDRGFFNLKTSHSHLVAGDKDEIQIVVGEKQVISGRISRTANSSGTPRIIGNKPLKLWFTEHSEVNGEIKITFINKKKIKLEALNK